MSGNCGLFKKGVFPTKKLCPDLLMCPDILVMLFFILMLEVRFTKPCFHSCSSDIYFYKAKPGKYQEAADLMREGRDLGLANGQSVIVHQQNMGKGGEKIFVWVDFFENYTQRASQAYSNESWAPFIKKFNSQDILEPIKSYQMTSLDEINPGDYIVQIWTWAPQKGKSAQTLKALEEAKEIFPDGWNTVKPYLRTVKQPK